MGGKRRVFGAAFKAKRALAAARGDRTTAQLASQFGIHTSQVTAWKKQLMGQVAELFVDGRQRRPDQTTDEHPAHGRQGTGDLEATLVAACAGVVATEHAVRLSEGREGCRRGGCGR